MTRALESDQSTSGFPAPILAAGPEAAAAWRDFVAGEGLSAATRKLYRQRAVHFLGWLAAQGTDLAQVSPTLIDSYLDGRANCDHVRMIYRTPLRRLFDRLAARQVIPFNPTRGGPGVDEPAAGPAEAEDGEAVPTLDNLKAFLFDLGSSEGSDDFRPGLVAMYPIIVGGMGTDRIAAFTGIPRAEVELYAGRLRQNGIWTPDGKVVVDFDDPNSAEAIVNLILIIGCAKGVFARFPGDEAEETEPSPAVTGRDSTESKP